MTQGTKTMLKPLGNRVLAKRLEHRCCSRDGGRESDCSRDGTCQYN